MLLKYSRDIKMSANLCNKNKQLASPLPNTIPLVQMFSCNVICLVACYRISDIKNNNKKLY